MERRFKFCSACGRERHVAHFDESKRYKGRLSDRCRECVKNRRPRDYSAKLTTPGSTTRPCHDCKSPTTDYRCAKCLEAWRKEYNVSEEAVRQYANSMLGMSHQSVGRSCGVTD